MFFRLLKNSRLFVVLLLLTFSLFLSVPSEADAGSCTCFCGSEKGATQKATSADFKVCQQTCDGAGMSFVGCTTAIEQHPQNNVRCFTAMQCGEQGGEFGEAQPPECWENMHYCFPGPGKPISLMVSIPFQDESGKGTIASVPNVGEYINVMYKFLLTTATFIAIVLIMVSGLQYIVASGRGEAAEARQRITRVVIGLALLLGAYLILFTINPKMIKLEPPKIPMIKMVVMGQTTCNDMLNDLPDGRKSQVQLQDENGNDIVQGISSPKQCGDVATVVKYQDGRIAPKGTLCVFEGACNQGAGEKCVIRGTGGACLSCAGVDDSEETKQKLLKMKLTKPTSGLCRALSTPVNPPAVSSCFLTGDSDVDTNSYVCAQMSYTCGENVNSCSDYENIVIVGGSTSNNLDDLEPGDIFGFDSDENLQTICTNDPCKFGNCKYSIGVGIGEGDGCIREYTTEEMRNLLPFAN